MREGERTGGGLVMMEGGARNDDWGRVGAGGRFLGDGGLTEEKKVVERKGKLMNRRKVYDASSR